MRSEKAAEALRQAGMSGPTSPASNAFSSVWIDTTLSPCYSKTHTNTRTQIHIAERGAGEERLVIGDTPTANITNLSTDVSQ